LEFPAGGGIAKATWRVVVEIVRKIVDDIWNVVVPKSSCQILYSANKTSLLALRRNGQLKFFVVKLWECERMQRGNSLYHQRLVDHVDFDVLFSGAESVEWVA
jgi:hypothetical protein